MQVYEVDVPAAARALRVDVAKTDGDLDIFVHPGHPPADPTRVRLFIADGSLDRIARRASNRCAPPLTNGPYSIMIVDQISLDAPVEYSLVVSLQSDPPAALVGVEALPRTRVDHSNERFSQRWRSASPTAVGRGSSSAKTGTCSPTGTS